MSPPDPAILHTLSLSPTPTTKTTLTPHGGSGFSRTAKLSITSHSSSKTPSSHPPLQRNYFVKTGPGPDAKLMFEGEHVSLNAIHDVVPTLSPRSYGCGELRNEKGVYFLVTDFVDLISSSSSSSTSKTLATKLAHLHTTPAPSPPGFSTPQFGFPVSTCCGSTPQPNNYASSWATFFADRRMRFILDRCAAAHGKKGGGGEGEELQRLVTQIVEDVVPRLLGDEVLRSPDGGPIVPVVVHGDLWSGNAGWGVIPSTSTTSTTDDKDDEEEEKEVGEIIYDPSATYAHSEYELGIMRLFGGFSRATFWDPYLSAVGGKCRPVEEFDDRVELYCLYHQLNHHALFGGGYRAGAIATMKSLVRKYGRG
ncbi:MAG: hypothetical protein M1817_005206 [Caeruleum heppii]|nr:MAG: hypothetical protein M1817_005206 [Caeruleum heppii]